MVPRFLHFSFSIALHPGTENHCLRLQHMLLLFFTYYIFLMVYEGVSFWSLEELVENTKVKGRVCNCVAVQSSDSSFNEDANLLTPSRRGQIKLLKMLRPVVVMCYIKDWHASHLQSNVNKFHYTFNYLINCMWTHRNGIEG